MSTETFTLEIVTPREISTREVRSLRLKDGSGSFGVLPGHCDLLVVLLPALGFYFDAAGGEHFLAVDGGLFTLAGGKGTITSGEVYEQDDPRELARQVEASLARRDASETAFLQMVKGLERSFLEKSASLGRERT